MATGKAYERGAAVESDAERNKAETRRKTGAMWTILNESDID
jgi:hypothetical protein